MDPTAAETKWMQEGYEGCYYSGALGGAWGIVHRMMERPFGADDRFGRVLELGAGQGQHAQFVRHQFDHYTLSDLRPELLDSHIPDKRFEAKKLDATDLAEIPDASVDRLIATCLLVHLPDPLSALREWRRVVRPGGVLTIYVPCEPSLVTRMLRYSYIWPRARRFGLRDPELMMYTGHKIHFPAMRAFLKRAFADDEVTVSRFPTRLLPWNLAFFDIYQVRKA